MQLEVGAPWLFFAVFRFQETSPGVIHKLGCPAFLGALGRQQRTPADPGQSELFQFFADLAPKLLPEVGEDSRIHDRAEGAGWGDALESGRTTLSRLADPKSSLRAAFEKSRLGSLGTGDFSTKRSRPSLGKACKYVWMTEDN